MKRYSIMVLVSLFMTCSPLVSNAANPVAGGACSKSGLTQTYKSKKFTCVKNGKKLVWNKGVTIPSLTKTAPIPPMIYQFFFSIISAF